MNSNLTHVKQSLEREIQIGVHLFDVFPWKNPEAYANWLAQTYYYVCYSTRLLASAAARFTIAENKLHLRCLEHTKEERSHEVLAIQDLKHLGYTLDKLPELAFTKALYQTQFYLIEHTDPVSLFGYILYLEGLSTRAGRKAQSETAKAHGPKASNFLRVHANEDDDHLAKAFEQLEKFDARQLHAVQESIGLSGNLYARVLMEIASKAGARINADEVLKLPVDLKSFG